MKQRVSAVLLLAAVLVAPPLAVAGDDHPGLTAADQAYSSGDYEAAAALYRRDAELGVVAAQVNLAFLFLDGQGVTQDPAEAALWFLRAAELGNSEAQQNLGILYRDGRGVAADRLESAKWFRLAGASADAISVENGLSPDQKVEVARRVAEWQARAGNPPRR
jgi:TPR repeat protein